MRLLALFILISFSVFSQDYRVPKDETAYYRPGYVFNFNSARKVVNWLGYTVTKDNVQGNEISDRVFYKDYSFDDCPSPKDYEFYNYSQGMLKPSSAARDSKEKMKALNNYLNVAPMDLAFDKGIWRILENLISGWAVMFDSVHVVTGPIYENKKPETIGESKINVPDKFFKVVMVYNGMDMGAIGFIIPNNGSANEIKKYSMPVDSVEFETGYDFFSELPDYLEFYMEEKVDPGVWQDKSMSYQLKSTFVKKGRCVAANKSDERCTIQTTCVTQNCPQHGCDPKSQ